MYAGAHVCGMAERLGAGDEARRGAAGRGCEGVGEAVSEPVKLKPHYWGITVH